MLGTSAATVRAAPLLLVDVETEQGIVGRAYVFGYRRSGARAIAAVLQEAAELVAGDAVAPLAIAAKLERRFALHRRHRRRAHGAVGARHGAVGRARRRRRPAARHACSAARRGRCAPTTPAASA